LPSTDPRFSWNVNRSARIWQGRGFAAFDEAVAVAIGKDADRPEAARLERADGFTRRGIVAVDRIRPDQAAEAPAGLGLDDVVIAMDAAEPPIMDGSAEPFRAALASSDLFRQTLAEKLMVYALGRGLEARDMPVVRRIVRDAQARDNRFSEFILGVVNSTPFRMRKTSS